MPTREEKQRRHRIIRQMREAKAEEARAFRNRLKSLRWYFVNTVIPGESDDPNHELEVQILDSEGRASSFDRCPRSTVSMSIDGTPVPPAVLDAAKRLTIGLGGQYVDEGGNLLSFQGTPLKWPDPPSREDAAQQILEAALRLHESGVPGARVRLRLLQTQYPETAATRRAATLEKEFASVT